MSEENLNLVKAICAPWQRGDFRSADWAHPQIEFGFADGPVPGNWTGIALPWVPRGGRPWSVRPP